MTSGIYVQDQVISEITLSLIKDTVFYDVNYYTGGLMKFGKNVSFNFVKQDCNGLLNKDKIPEGQTSTRFSTFLNDFSPRMTKTTCSSGRQSRGICVYYFSSTMLKTENKTYYSRENLDSYGKNNVDYFPVSLSETQNDNIKKYSYIENCKIGQKDNFGKLAFYFWHTDKDFSYPIFNKS